MKKETMQVEVSHDEDHTVDYRTAYCPVCGSSSIGGAFLGVFRQKDDGSFIIDDVDYVGFHLAVTNVNSEVVCFDEQCGIPSCGFTDTPIHEGQAQLIYDQYTVWCDDNDEEILSYEEWSTHWTYTPWRGVYGDCVDAYGTTMTEIHGGKYQPKR